MVWNKTLFEQNAPAKKELFNIIFPSAELFLFGQNSPLKRGFRALWGPRPPRALAKEGVKGGELICRPMQVQIEYSGGKAMRGEPLGSQPGEDG